VRSGTRIPRTAPDEITDHKVVLGLFRSTEPIDSVRISRGYRALGLRDGDLVTWFWIGSHTDYDKLLA
jgi:hypothetical protein